eukprot:scaffold40247_cov65-Phaeocystis_antarctica.AAC.4
MRAGRARGPPEAALCGGELPGQQPHISAFHFLAEGYSVERSSPRAPRTPPRDGASQKVGEKPSYARRNPGPSPGNGGQLETTLSPHTISS